MNKSDLKDGMIITYRNGQKRIVMFGRFINLYDFRETGNGIDDYNEDLTSKYEVEDIVKIEYMNKVLWERKKLFTLRMAVKERRKTIGSNIKHKNHKHSSGNLGDLFSHLSIHYDNLELLDEIDKPVWEVVKNNE